MVEFDVVNDDDGKLKADNVTAPGGGPCTGPRRRRRKNGEETTEEEAGDEPQPSTGDESQQRRSKKKQGSKANKPARQQPQWHDILSDSVKEALDKKGIRRTTGTMDVSVGNVRIKLGTRSYTSMAHSDGILAEGTFTCDENGVVGLQWERALTFAADGTWSSEATEGLLASLDLSSGKELLMDRVCACCVCVLLSHQSIAAEHQTMPRQSAPTKLRRHSGVKARLILGTHWRATVSRCAESF